jgi:hypothetical protein
MRCSKLRTEVTQCTLLRPIYLNVIHSQIQFQIYFACILTEWALYNTEAKSYFKISDLVLQST